MKQLAERIEQAVAIIADSNRTERLVQVNLEHLERLRSKVQRYEQYVPADQEDFNYQRAVDLTDKAEECEIELRGFMREFEKAFKQQLQGREAILVEETKSDVSF